MTREPPGDPWQPRVLHRIARAFCPPSERPWVDAMLAELGAIEEPGQRRRWMIGVASVVAASIQTNRAAVLSPPKRWALLLALCAAALSGGSALVGYEGLGIDDDGYLVLAVFSSVAFIGLGALAILRIFASRRFLPGTRS